MTTTTPIRHRNIWTREEETNLLSQVKQKCTLFGIAQQHQRTDSAIAYRLELIVKSLHKDGVKFEEIVSRTGLDILTVESILGRQNISSYLIFNMVTTMFVAGLVIGSVFDVWEILTGMVIRSMCTIDTFVSEIDMSSLYDGMLEFITRRVHDVDVFARGIDTDSLHRVKELLTDSVNDSMKICHGFI